MIEKVGHIKNPLTVISVFAGIAEISGTIVLPFIAPQNQSTYIWFLMLFPPFLVGIFFATLNWNHKTLYAPSDYQNEDNFVNPIGKSTIQERVVKLEEEVDEVVSDTVISAVSMTEEPSPPSITESVHSQDDTETCTQTTSPPFAEPTIKYSIKENSGSYQIPSERESISRSSSSSFLPSADERNRLSADIRLIEELAIKRITKLTGKSFRQGIKFESRKGKSVLFDAVSIEGNHFSAVEVKLFRNNVFSPSRITKILLDCQHIVNDEDFLVRNFTLHLVIVLDAEAKEQHILKNKILRMIDSSDYNIDLHVVTMKELETEF
jgi:hypothetical protein